MGLAEQIKLNDWRSVRSAIAKLNTKLGPTSTPTFAGQTIINNLGITDVSTISTICTLAAGLNVLRVTGLQADDVVLTGILRGAYIDVSNGNVAATGTIRGMELKARTEAPGDTGNDVAVLEGLSISVDSKGHSVTTMRAAEFILDGSVGGTINEAVGLRIANNLQAAKATISYGLQIYCDSFAYTADIQLSNQATIGISTSGAAFKLSPSGNVGIKLPTGVEPSEMLSIGSTSGTEQLDLYHSGSHAKFCTTEGAFQFKTKNTSDRNTYLGIHGNDSPGIGYLNIYDQDQAESIEIRCSLQHGYIKTTGSAPGPIHLQDSAHSNVRLFANATEGETKELAIYGYRTGDEKRILEIGVGVDAADTASFDGVSNYKFDGNIEITGLTASKLIATDANKKLVSSDLTSWITQTANQVLVTDDGDGTITLSAPQDIHTGASPTFAYINITDESNGYQIDSIRLLSLKGSGGNENIFLGESGNFTMTGLQNIFAGKLAGEDLTEGNYNICLGPGSGRSITTGYSNVGTGHSSLDVLTEGYYNYALGNASLCKCITGCYNISIGANALSVGGEGSASYNVVIGGNTGNSLFDGTYNILIGYGVDVPSVDLNDYRLNIGDLILGDLDASILTIAGNLIANLGTFDEINIDNTGNTGTKLAVGTAGGSPANRAALIELVSSSGDPVGLGSMLDVTFYPTMAETKNYCVAGNFFNKVTGTMDQVSVNVIALYGGINSALVATFKEVKFKGLQFNVQNVADITGGIVPKNLVYKGIEAYSQLGYATKTISGKVITKNYGLDAKATMDGIFNSDQTNCNYGAYIKTEDLLDDGTGDITSYGLYIDACADNADIGSGGTVISWGLYEANGRDNALCGNLRLGSTTAPTDPLSITLATESFDVVDSGSVAATEQDWIEVKVGGNTGYIRVFAAK